MILPSLPKLRLTKKQQLYSDAEIYQAMLRREAALGGKLFGPLPSGHRREFFCLDVNTWVWHEEWLDDKNQRRHKMTRYDVRPDGVLKAQDSMGYQKLSTEEAINLKKAIELYQDHVVGGLYGKNSDTV
jgi:hypothetical protein